MSQQGESHGPGSGSPEEPDPFENLVLDEEFVRSAPAREPSARARMLTERWRREPPPDTTWRGSAWGPPKKDRTNLKIAVWFVLLSVLLLASWQSDRVRALIGTDDDGGGGSSAAPPVTPSPAASAVGATREHPFAGSPAADYADNEAGILLPEARAVGRYGAAEVRQALETTRALLIAGNLDRDALMSGSADKFLALVDPGSIDAAHMRRYPLAYTTRFDGGEVVLAGPVIKVTGTMTYELNDEGILTVHSDYSFVYPLARVNGGPDEVTRSLVRRVMDTQVFKGSKYAPTPKGKVWFVSRSMGVFNSSCTRDDGFVRPYFDGTEDSSRPTGAPIDPYDRTPAATASPTGAEEEDGCRAMSRI